MADTILATRPASAPVRALRVFKGVRRQHIPLGISVFLLLLVAGTGIFANLIAPHDPRRGHLEEAGLGSKAPRAAPGLIQKTTTCWVTTWGRGRIIFGARSFDNRSGPGLALPVISAQGKAAGGFGGSVASLSGGTQGPARRGLAHCGKSRQM